MSFGLVVSATFVVLTSFSIVRNVEQGMSDLTKATKDRKLMRVFVTKYALTSGIQDREAELCKEGRRMICCRDGAYVEYFHGQDWHTTHRDAEDRVRDMVAAKLESLDKQRERVAKIGRALGMACV